jgi:spore germination protein YaaH
MVRYRKVFAFVLFIALLWSGSASAAGFTNVYYAIQSYSERSYAVDASQTALGWAQIRKSDGTIYFSQQKINEWGVPEGDIPALVNELRSNGSDLNLSVFLSDRAIFNELLDNPATQEKVISDMVDALKGIRYYDYNAPRDSQGFHPYYFVTDNLGKIIEYDGLIIDFEQLYNGSGSYKAKFSQFLNKLKEQMPTGKKLTVCLPPKRKSPIVYPDGYDYNFIGKIADEVILMAHEYQWYDGSIKASAPISYVKEALDFAVNEISSEKILLQVNMSPVRWRDGILLDRPSYSEMLAALDGRASDEVKVISVTPKEKRYNDEMQVGYASLKHEIKMANGSTKVVTDEFYFETAQSIARKRALAGEMKIKGMSAWRLGLGASEPMDELIYSKYIRSKVESFVERLYTIALNRESEPAGLAFWTDRLISQKYNAAYVVQYILLDAPEFLGRKLTNEQFVEISYMTFFNRNSDPAGKKYWLSKLAGGYSKRWVIANMLNAPTKEFDNLCKEAGIITGRIGTGAADLPKK